MVPGLSGRPSRASLGEQRCQEKDKDGGSRFPGLERKARKTQSCRGAHFFPGAPGTDMVTQHHPTGASRCPRTTVCVGSRLRRNQCWERVSPPEGGSEQSSQALISLKLSSGDLCSSLPAAQRRWVSKVSGGGHVGVPVTHTAFLRAWGVSGGDLSPAWVTRPLPRWVVGLTPGDLPWRLSVPGADPSSAQPQDGG